MDRKLAAILAADVVGYSAMMERDETGTHERLQAGLREVFQPTIAKHHSMLTGVSELKVLSGSATYGYKDKHADIRQIGKELNVAYDRKK